MTKMFKKQHSQWYKENIHLKINHATWELKRLSVPKLLLRPNQTSWQTSSDYSRASH